MKIGSIDNRWKISTEDAIKEYPLILEKKSNLTSVQRRVVIKYVESLELKE